MKPFINIEATAEVRIDEETRRRCWRDDFGAFFSGPDDPNYAVITIAPVRIEYYGSYAEPPEIYQPDSPQ